MIVRLNFLLLLLVIASALTLVQLQYRSRLLYSNLDREVVRARQLESESETLRVSMQTQAAAARVDNFARTELGMRPADPGTTRYVHLPVESVARIRALEFDVMAAQLPTPPDQSEGPHE